MTVISQRILKRCKLNSFRKIKPKVDVYYFIFFPLCEFRYMHYLVLYLRIKKKEKSENALS